MKQHSMLKSKISDLSKKFDKDTTIFRTDEIHMMNDNRALLNEINVLRKIGKFKPLKFPSSIGNTEIVGYKKKKVEIQGNYWADKYNVFMLFK